MVILRILIAERDTGDADAKPQSSAQWTDERNRLTDRSVVGHHHKLQLARPQTGDRQQVHGRRDFDTRQGGPQ